MRARKAKVVKENSERWLLTYSDLITLLMIFFIILYAISTTNARKFEDLTGALKQAFNNGTYQLITVGGTPGIPRSLTGMTQSQRTLYKRIKAGVEQLSKELGIRQNIVHVGSSREGIVITLSGSLLYYPGDVQLKPESLAMLKGIAQLLRNLPNTIRVEGNTDNQVSTSTVYSSNWVLSVLRAAAIVSYLGGPGGVDPRRLQAEGLGQYHAVATNATPAGRALNRRADIVVLYP